MELFIAIALLCQATHDGVLVKTIRTYDNTLQCQQSYVHCVNMKSSMTKQDALERCILERK